MLITTIAWLIAPASILVGTLCVPDSWANCHVRLFRRDVTLLASLQLLVAICGAVATISNLLPANHQTSSTAVTNSLPLATAVYYDGVACLMLGLVSFVGWVVCQYSIRYLDGDANQGRYFRWTAFTLGSVSLMIVSGNLLMFVATWIMTSLGLHQLLLHYGHRPAARRAAWTKFTISRVGDAALVAATVIIYDQFQTINFNELFIKARSLDLVTPWMQVAGFLLVAGAVTKSAQFPFHTWLPQTMETPTPVSALMHAGIVNAGGYLIIRTSPLIALTPWALTAVAIIGGFTACFAAVVMLTQTSIKKSLAYSTIAQMGFMLLQCGLGAFSAAMLHILAHSLYKAYAFLSSGSALSEPTITSTKSAVDHSSVAFRLVLVGSSLMGLLAFALALLGIDLIAKPGGFVLGGILCFALTHWIGQVMKAADRQLLVPALAMASTLCLVYAVSYFAVDKTISASLPISAAPSLAGFVVAVVLVGFLGMGVLHLALANERGRRVLTRWYIHASNGFYMESTLRRLLGPLAERY